MNDVIIWEYFPLNSFLNKENKRFKTTWRSASFRYSRAVSRNGI